MFCQSMFVNCTHRTPDFVNLNSNVVVRTLAAGGFALRD